ncbi:conserved hypothetical protein [Desulfosarcina cetonica]|uniref:50S ribosomal protein L11 methyltransferase n=1 Tax=Desulfosarcina cetonica TaxID=90730 RepID=UPI0009F9323D|nr:50S ribosomal protein L11 methyltransferase [Desulfosarcina cetonica]VTR69044.1 conserved hypothetical protein [Desulfosarcina cetonica]
MTQSLELIRYIALANHKVDFNELKKIFNCNHPSGVKKLKSVIKKLINDGILTYSSQYGRSNIEVSYDRPTLVSQNIVLKPSNSNYFSEKYHVVSLYRGSSFGVGDHPTTRLCIKLMDKYFYSEKIILKRNKINCLDIGTGSGVLAIIAAKIGAKSVVALDNDPCSLFDAKKNICINNLSHKIIVSDTSISKLTGSYDLILANLRTPTLLEISKKIQHIINMHCDIILSGIKEGESKFVINQYEKAGFSLVEEITENGWMALWILRA